MPRNELSAKNLKGTLWDTINDLREQKIDPGVADAIASQSRELVRVTREQRMIVQNAGVAMPDELVQFATGAKP
jgi:hypothetical protein